MVGKEKNVQEYLDELERNRKDKPEQVREALEIYLELWKKAISNGVVGPSDGINEALAKIEGRGGLNRAADALPL
jgi:hypothetical protein